MHPGSQGIESSGAQGLPAWKAESGSLQPQDLFPEGNANGDHVAPTLSGHGEGGWTPRGGGGSPSRQSWQGESCFGAAVPSASSADPLPCLNSGKLRHRRGPEAAHGRSDPGRSGSYPSLFSSPPTCTSQSKEQNLAVRTPSPSNPGVCNSQPPALTTGPRSPTGAKHRAQMWGARGTAPRAAGALRDSRQVQQGALFPLRVSR